jgi:osmotically-inducible protein OsmY
MPSVLPSDAHVDLSTAETRSPGQGEPVSPPTAASIRHALLTSGYLVLRDLEVLVEGRRVCLKGKVPSYFMKQMAQTIVLAHPGVEELVDGLQVVRGS